LRSTKRTPSGIRLGIGDGNEPENPTLENDEPLSMSAIRRLIAAAPQRSLPCTAPSTVNAVPGSKGRYVTIFTVMFRRSTPMLAGVDESHLPSSGLVSDIGASQVTASRPQSVWIGLSIAELTGNVPQWMGSEQQLRTGPCAGSFRRTLKTFGRLPAMRSWQTVYVEMCVMRQVTP
jgi:hypothetical protein